MNTPKIDNESASETSSKLGFHLVMPAVLPGLLGASLITAVGMPVAIAAVAIVGAVAAAVTIVAVAGAAGAAAAVVAVVAAVVAAGAAGVAGVAGAAAGAVAVAGAALAGATAKKEQDSAKKILAGIFAGAAIGGAAMYGAAINAPEAQKPAEKPKPVSTLHLEQRGGALCRDFTLAENTVATAQSANGRTVYTLTVPEGCMLKP